MTGVKPVGITAEKAFHSQGERHNLNSTTVRSSSRRRLRPRSFLVVGGREEGEGGRGRKPKIIILGGSAVGGTRDGGRPGPYFKPANVPLSVSISASAKFIPSVLLPPFLPPPLPSAATIRTRPPNLQTMTGDIRGGRIFSTLYAALD